MLIKLATCEEGQQERIDECCKKYGSIFIPLTKNKFGILAESATKVSLGKVSEEDISKFNIKAFVDIYNCSEGSGKSLSCIRIFKRRDAVPYIGLILDTKFFENLIRFCIDRNIPVNYISILSNYGTFYTGEDVEEFKKLLDEGNVKAILKICVNLNDKNIIFSRSGYIDIAARLDFYMENCDIINKMISTGI